MIMPPSAPPLSLSVVIFAYNEEQNVQPVLEEAAAFLQGQGLDWEIIFVDDGSTDGTRRSAEAVAGRLEGRMKVLSYRPNQGIGHALRVGFAAATREWITLMPADGQIPPEGLLRLLEPVRLQPGLELVTCHYPERFREADGPGRKVLSRGLRALTWLATGVRRPLDGIYLVRRSLLGRLDLRSETFFLNLELPLRALHGGASAAAATMNIRPRLAGRSKVLNTRRVAGVVRELAALGLELRLGIRVGAR